VATADFDDTEPLAWLPEDWARFVASKGERPYRALQVFRWVHGRGVADPAQMTDLGKSLRAVIEQAGLSMPAKVEHVHRSDDETQKALLAFDRGGTVETVLIPPLARDEAERSEDDEESDDEPSTPLATSGLRPAAKRVTQCISSQVGCAMGCVFCASGVAGLKRNLTAGEIVSQVLIGRRLLGPDEALRNVVLMGMGEPLHNYGNVARALTLLMHKEGINLSSRRVTVSTSGLVPEIERLGRDFGGNVSLAISLHAAEDELRTALMPINKRYPLRELMAALERYPLPPRRRITVEYTLIRGVNDSDADARALARLLRRLRCKVNLIPMNPVPGAPYEMPSPERLQAFQALLWREGLSVFLRKQRGDDIAAACGQLALQGELAKKRRLPMASTSATSDAARASPTIMESSKSDG
jgi:23S rRNA (adenine2503-C2)-methyltransferase